MRAHLLDGARVSSARNAVSLNADLSGIGLNRGMPEVLIRW